MATPARAAIDLVFIFISGLRPGNVQGWQAIRGGGCTGYNAKKFSCL